uniref:Uncharacterized protein n=1 Tax=Plectus sambesii TaxID=2011161 RepID=A0A914WU31_9BILA
MAIGLKEDATSTGANRTVQINSDGQQVFLQPSPLYQPAPLSYFVQPANFTEDSNQFDYNNTDNREECRQELPRNDAQQQGNGVQPQEDANDEFININEF